MERRTSEMIYKFITRRGVGGDTIIFSSHPERTCLPHRMGFSYISYDPFTSQMLVECSLCTQLIVILVYFGVFLFVSINSGRKSREVERNTLIKRKQHVLRQRSDSMVGSRNGIACSLWLEHRF